MKTNDSQLILFSAHSLNELLRLIDNTSKQLEIASFTELALKSQQDFLAEAQHKLALIAKDSQSLISLLQQARKKIVDAPEK